MAKEEFIQLLEDHDEFYMVYYMDRHTAMDSGWVKNVHYKQPTIKRFSVEDNILLALSLFQNDHLFIQNGLLFFIQNDEELIRKTKIEITKYPEFKEQYDNVDRLNHFYWF